MSGQYDLAVIGGGPAGYVAAIKAAQLGGKVILFEKDTLGGTCLNRGCIPTKTYLATAGVMRSIRGAASRGILSSAEASIDMPAAVSYKNKVVRQLIGGVEGLLRAGGIKVVDGRARLSGETRISCAGDLYEAASILLCGGSKVGRLPIEGADGENMLTSDDILDLRQLPARLAIIGGGVIGCEIAAVFQTFGSAVTILEAEDRLLPQMDEDVSAAVANALQKSGVSILTAQKVERFTHTGAQSTVHYSGGRLDADKVLISVGRVADLECLGALADHIITERGKVKVDCRMRTNIPNIYAPGDLNGLSMLAHAAFKMGEIAAENAMGGDRRCDLRFVPSCIYTMPEASGVGMTQRAAEEAFGATGVAVGRFPFSCNGRAVAGGEPEGFVKVLAGKRYGELLGVHIVGAEATELIAEAASLMAMEITVHEASEIIHAHPTLSEAFMEACADALGRCIHCLKSKKASR